MKWIGLMIATMLLLAVACKAAIPTQTPAPSPTSTPVATTALLPASDLFLTVTSPQDESVLRESPVQVRGRTMADAVLSINGQPTVVNADGSFSDTVTLAEGPNAIEIVSSDFRGNQRAQVISVIYIR